MQVQNKLTVAGLKRLTGRINERDNAIPVAFKETEETACIVNAQTGAVMAYITKDPDTSLLKRQLPR